MPIPTNVNAEQLLATMRANAAAWERWNAATDAEKAAELEVDRLQQEINALTPDADQSERALFIQGYLAGQASKKSAGSSSDLPPYNERTKIATNMDAMHRRLADMRITEVSWTRAVNILWAWEDRPALVTIEEIRNAIILIQEMHRVAVAQLKEAMPCEWDNSMRLLLTMLKQPEKPV